MWFGKLFIMGLMLSVGIMQAQDTTCPALVEQALASVEEACDDLDRNEACYGHVLVEAELTSTEATFDTAGDVTALQEIERLTLTGMDVDEALWGISVIRMQANLPDTLPGQNVTFLMFGEVELEAEAENEFFDAPMQAFYFTTGIGDAGCEEAPQSGMMIQTPEGIGEVSFMANEVEIILGSTIYLQAQPDGEMIVSVIEGRAILTAFGESVVVPAGMQVRIELDDKGSAIAAPGQPQPYDLDALTALPLILLERDIEIAPPLENAEDAPEETPVPEDDEAESGGALQVSANGGTALSDCSIDSTEEYDFAIDNQGNRTLSLYWLSYDCEPIPYGTVEPGGTFAQTTFPTHPWILTDAETGETIFGPWGANSPSGFTITVTE